MSTPAFDPAARYDRANYTDAYKIAIEAVRADPGHVGELEIIPCDMGDWRFALIHSGDGERSISQLVIGAPQLQYLKNQALKAVAALASGARDQPIFCRGNYYPGDEAAQTRMRSLATDIATMRLLNQRHECTLITVTGQAMRLVDDPGQNFTPVIEIWHAMQDRRDAIPVLVNQASAQINGSRDDADVQKALEVFEAAIGRLLGHA